MPSSTSNRLDLGAGKILQLDKNPLGYVLRLLESNTYLTPRLAFTAEEFDTLMKSVDVVVLGGRVKLQRMDKSLWIVLERDGVWKVWAEIGWAKVWRLAESL